MCSFAICPVGLYLRLSKFQTKSLNNQQVRLDFVKSQKFFCITAAISGLTKQHLTELLQKKKQKKNPVPLIYLFVKLESEAVWHQHKYKIVFSHSFMIFLHPEYTPSVSTLSPAGVKECCRPSLGQKPTRSGPMWRSSSAGSSPRSNRTAVKPADQREGNGDMKVPRS